MRIGHEFGRAVPSSSRPRVLWAIPARDGNTWAEFTVSYGYCMALFQKENIECEPYIHSGDAFIQKARNMSVAKFMSNPLNGYLIMGDVDQAWQLQPFIDMLYSEHEFTAMCPRVKCDTEIYSTKLNGKITGKFMETDRVGTGFVIFKRSVFEKMFEAYPELRCYDYDVDGGNGYSLFSLLEKKHVTGEDLVFCDRWKAIGGGIHVHTDSPMRHMGPQAWEGNIKNVLKKGLRIRDSFIDKINNVIKNMEVRNELSANAV